MIKLTDVLEMKTLFSNDLKEIETALGIELPEDFSLFFGTYDVLGKELAYPLIVLDSMPPFAECRKAYIKFNIFHKNEKLDLSCFFDMKSIKIMALEDDLFMKYNLLGFAETVTNNYWAIGYGKENYGKIFYVDSAIYSEIAFFSFNDFINNIDYSVFLGSILFE